MTKVKLNSGLVALLIVASMFSGWQTMLLVTVLLFAFCDIEEKVKDIAIKVITFYFGLTIVSLAWDLIYDGIILIINSIDDIVTVLNNYVTYDHAISLGKLQSYIMTPATQIAGIANNVISYLFTFAKFAFIITLITGKTIKETPVSKKINEYVKYVLNFIQSKVK